MTKPFKLLLKICCASTTTPHPTIRTITCVAITYTFNSNSIFHSLIQSLVPRSSMAQPQKAPGNSSPELGTAAIDRFCCQYLQLEAHLDYPDGQVLKRPGAQDEIFDRIFAHSSPSSKSVRFQLRVLKELVKRIQASISDDEADDFVCEVDKHSSFNISMIWSDITMVGGIRQDNGPPG